MRVAEVEMSPVEDAERVLRRVAGFRRMGFDELDTQKLASSDVTFAAVTVLLKQGCPKRLVAAILT